MKNDDALPLCASIAHQLMVLQDSKQILIFKSLYHKVEII